MRNTKFLERPRINKILSAVYDYPLAILEAPMGYGKTTAVKKFIETEILKHFWFTFPDLSNSELVFWSKFTDEIVKIDAQAGLALKSLGLPYDAPQTEKVLQILSDVITGDNLLMVLDDYHLARDKGMKKLIMRLVREELDGLHILLITRDTSDIEFIDLLSKGLCCVLSRQHLKFTESEMRDYCLMMLDGITDSDLYKICEYTDGWISFIYIILLSLENGIPVGMCTTIEEMVEKALFTPYDKDIQYFLLTLSIMEDFTVEQAEYVTGNKNTALILKKLNKENAFVLYDEKSRTYTIHSILRDYLRLKQNFSQEEICGLYERLGDWYLGRQEFQRAYGYWNRAGQAERILSHMNEPQNIRNVLIGFEGSDDMFDSIPREILFQYPLAYLLHIFHSFIQGKQNATLGWPERLDELKRYYEQIDIMDETYRNRILGEIMIIRKLSHFNHLREMISFDKEILRLLNGQNSYILLRGYTFTFGSLQLLYLYFRDAGSFRELSDISSKYVDFIEFSNGWGMGCDSLAQAEYALETGDFDNVEQNVLQTIAKAETMSQIYIIICAIFCLIRLRIVQDRLPEALDLLEQLQRDAKKINRPFYNSAVDLCRGYIFACLCQPEQIPSWLQTGDMESANMYYMGFSYSYLVYGKAVLAQKKYAKLDALTTPFNKYFSVYSNQLGFIHNQIFESVAKCNLYGTSTGAAILEAALNTARADRLVMPFVESSPHITDILQLIVQNNPGDEYLDHILTLCQKYNQTIKGLIYPSVQLSQREIDILSLAAEGLSRKEMAARLYISEETVKSHFKNIYQKLGVNSKVSAIRIAQERGYLKTDL